MCDGRIFLQRLGQGLEAATDQGLRLVPELYRTPGLGTLGAYVVLSQRDLCDGRIFLQRLGQGLEAAADQGWCLDFGALPFKSFYSN